MEQVKRREFLLRQTGRISCALFSHQYIPVDEIGMTLSLIGAALDGCGRETSDNPAPARAIAKPAVAPRHSITDEWLICLEDGKSFKTLKRHLRTKYGLSPVDYRKRWNLPDDYPIYPDGGAGIWPPSFKAHARSK